MSFESSVEFEARLDQQSLREARRTVENELGDVEVSVGSGSMVGARADGGRGTPGGGRSRRVTRNLLQQGSQLDSVISLGDRRNFLLEEILEAIQDDGVGGGGGGGLRLPRLPGLGGLIGGLGGALTVGLSAAALSTIAEGLDINIPEGLPTEIPVTIPDVLPSEIPVTLPEIPAGALTITLGPAVKRLLDELGQGSGGGSPSTVTGPQGGGSPSLGELVGLALPGLALGVSTSNPLGRPTTNPGEAALGAAGPALGGLGFAAGVGGLGALGGVGPAASLAGRAAVGSLALTGAGAAAGQEGGGGETTINVEANATVEASQSDRRLERIAEDIAERKAEEMRREIEREVNRR
jgi:hypothetical protein